MPTPRHQLFHFAVIQWIQALRRCQTWQLWNLQNRFGRHQESQFSSCASIYLNHCSLPIRQPQLYPDSGITCHLLGHFVLSLSTSVLTVWSFPSLVHLNTVSFDIHWVKKWLLICSATFWTEWTATPASFSCSRDSPPDCHGELLL